MRDLYEAMLALKEDEQMALARLHKAKPQRLISRFLHSVDAAAQRTPTTEHFYDGARKDPLAEDPVHPSKIHSTFDFATQVAHRRGEVAGRPELGFAYVDREIFPARTIVEKDRWRPRTLDLLLVSTASRRPIVAELKQGGDSLPYFALIQALMHAAELLSPSQRQRLSARYPRAGFDFAEEGPWLDVFVIEFAAPTGANRGPSLELSQALTAELMATPRVAKLLGCVAYLRADEDGERLGFKAVYPDGKEA